jgi:hypothetical protein
MGGETMNKMMPNSPTWDKIEQFKRKELAKLLAQCTEGEQAFFLRLYPDGVEGMTESKIPRAIQQVERTIQKANEK